MLGFILIVAIVGVIVWYVIKDMNEPLADKIAANAKKTGTEAKNVLVNVADLNNDGKVNVQDVKHAGATVKETAKKVAKKTRKKKDA